MGGNQNESGRSGTHLTPVNVDDTIGKVWNTSSVTDPNRHRGGLPSPSSRSYFSTLEVPQSFSFEQKFQRSNAMILSDMKSLMSHDRLLSSPSGENIKQGSSSQMNCASNPNTIVNFNPGQHIREMVRGTSSTKAERPRKDGSTRSLSSQKRQMYLEKRRHSSPCWPMERRKRSSHSDDEDEGISLQPVRKVFVNEEKMAARFDGLSLSNSLFASREAEAQRIMDDIDNSLMDSDEEDDEVLSKTNVSGVKRLQMSHHLKTALRQSKPEVLPEKIVQKIANPCTAMILWQPPDLTPSRTSEQTAMTEEELTAERPVAHANLQSSLSEYHPDGADEDMEL